jgi:hypothetical protein
MYLIILFLLFLLFLFFFLNILFSKDFVNSKKHNYYDLQKDGCCIFSNVFEDSEIYYLKNNCEKKNYKDVKHTLLNSNKLNNLIHSLLSSEYVFQDYIWIIEKSAVHTCHRDNNGDFFNENQKYPSYTMIVYLENIDKCLGVIPTSHNDINSFNINLSSTNLEHLTCKKGDVILFNANLIHVGTVQENNNHLRIQLKVTHKDDLDKLSYYQNFNKVLNQDNTLPVSILQIQKNVSCMFPYISNLTQTENINSSRGSVNGAKVGIFQKLFSFLFYGNSRFYDLPNAFDS